ncbi:hypothetical protein OE88DRAFT_1650643 [Heliocybe sulcata]|uniref:DUF7918 domain-containing protein n=1 Tax=Heliocybe sulcata TaxID=5364 RepID=A0A5C3NJN8_9AGAM|nr:hypothetical protein OE88DRAFT_1650643 [Heliocybe sulcata]
MLHVREFDAWITVDGEQLPQYSPEVNHQRNEATCWIPSQAGKKFAVHWRDNLAGRKVDMAGFLSVDGVNCGSTRLEPARNRPAEVKKDYITTSLTTRRFLVFSDLVLTDDDDPMDDTTIDIKDIGQIILDIHEVQVVRRSSPWPGLDAKAKERISSQARVHEKVKKAGAHCVGFTEDIKLDKARLYDRHKRLDKTPCATFIFKYNPMDVLMANGIAPSPKAQIAENGAVNADVDMKPGNEASLDEIKAMEAHLEALKARKEIKELEARLFAAKARAKKPSGSVKTEKNSDAGSFAKGEIIDLT